MAVIRRYELTDEEWERLKVYFPERKAGAKGRPPKDTRQMLNGIFWILRSGASWRDLPERYFRLHGYTELQELLCRERRKTE